MYLLFLIDRKFAYKLLKYYPIILIINDNYDKLLH